LLLLLLLLLRQSRAVVAASAACDDVDKQTSGGLITVYRLRPYATVSQSVCCTVVRTYAAAKEYWRMN